MTSLEGLLMIHSKRKTRLSKSFLLWTKRRRMRRASLGSICGWGIERRTRKKSVGEVTCLRLLKRNQWKRSRLWTLAVRRQFKSKFQRCRALSRTRRPIPMLQNRIRIILTLPKRILWTWPQRKRSPSSTWIRKWPTPMLRRSSRIRARFRSRSRTQITHTHRTKAKPAKNKAQ